MKTPSCDFDCLQAGFFDWITPMETTRAVQSGAIHFACMWGYQGYRMGIAIVDAICSSDKTVVWTLQAGCCRIWFLLIPTLCIASPEIAIPRSIPFLFNTSIRLKGSAIISGWADWKMALLWAHKQELIAFPAPDSR